MTRPGSVQPNIPLTPAAAPDKSALPASAQSAATAPDKSSNAQPNVKQVYTVVKPRPVATPVNHDANHQPIAAPKQPIPAPKPVDTPKPIATPAKPEATIARPAIIPPRPIAAQIKPVSVAKSCDIRAKKAVEQFEVASRIDVTDGAESRSADTDATASHSAGSEPFLQDEPVAEESVSRFSRSALSKNDVDSVIGDLILTSDEEDEFELILNIGDCTFDEMNIYIQQHQQEEEDRGHEAPAGPPAQPAAEPPGHAARQRATLPRERWEVANGPWRTPQGRSSPSPRERKRRQGAARRRDKEENGTYWLRSRGKPREDSEDSEEEE